MNLDRTAHPCTGCTSTPYRGVIACPVAGVVLNKGRHRRVRRMAPAAAQATLYRAWQVRWTAAQESNDRAVIRFLEWLSKGRNVERLREKLGPLGPADQVSTLAQPLVARARRSRANGGNTSARGSDPARGSGSSSEAQPARSASATRTTTPREARGSGEGVNGLRTPTESMRIQSALPLAADCRCCSSPETPSFGLLTPKAAHA